LELEREQKRRRKAKGTKGTRESSSKITGAKTSNATTISVTEEANALSAGDNRACSDGGSRENKYGDGMT